MNDPSNIPNFVEIGLRPGRHKDKDYSRNVVLDKYKKPASSYLNYDQNLEYDHTTTIRIIIAGTMFKLVIPFCEINDIIPDNKKVIINASIIHFEFDSLCFIFSPLITDFLSTLLIINHYVLSIKKGK